jgi:hypothetical protein
MATVFDLPVEIYAVNSGVTTIKALAGFTTLILATNMEKKWFSTDGKRRNFNRISAPNIGTELTWTQ